jgi:hypothetical protein
MGGTQHEAVACNARLPGRIGSRGTDGPDIGAWRRVLEFAVHPAAFEGVTRRFGVGR